MWVAWARVKQHTRFVPVFVQTRHFSGRFVRGLCARSRLAIHPVLMTTRAHDMHMYHRTPGLMPGRYDVFWCCCEVCVRFVRGLCARSRLAIHPVLIVTRAHDTHMHHRTHGSIPGGHDVFWCCCEVCAGLCGFVRTLSPLCTARLFATITSARQTCFRTVY